MLRSLAASRASREVDRYSSPLLFVNEGRLCIHAFVSECAGTSLEPILKQLNYQPATELDLRRAGRRPPTVIVIDDEVPDAIGLCRRLPPLVPKLMISSQTSFEYRLACARGGVDAIIRRPVDVNELTDWLEDFSERQSEEAPNVLIVDDDELTAELYAELLRRDGMQVHVTQSPAEVLHLIEHASFDLVLMDLRMPEISGIELARMIRQSRQFLSVPIVFLSAEQDARIQIAARRQGGDDFISKHIDPATLVTLVNLRVERARALKTLIERDGLTGLLNHSRFKERVVHELERTRRTGADFTLAMIDVDHFKRINDAWGHQMGDQVIRRLARVLVGGLRRIDIVGRYGGEEFGVLLLDTRLEAAGQVIERFRQQFQAIAFDAPGGSFSVTISAGVADSSAWNGLHELVSAADSALYQSKHAGRNRVSLALKQDGDGRPRFRGVRARN